MKVQDKKSSNYKQWRIQDPGPGDVEFLT